MKTIMSLFVSQMANLLSVCRQEFCVVELVGVAVGISGARCALSLEFVQRRVEFIDCWTGKHGSPDKGYCRYAFSCRRETCERAE